MGSSDDEHSSSHDVEGILEYSVEGSSSEEVECRSVDEGEEGGEIVEPCPSRRPLPVCRKSEQTPSSVVSCVTDKTLIGWSARFGIDCESFRPRAPEPHEGDGCSAPRRDCSEL